MCGCELETDLKIFDKQKSKVSIGLFFISIKSIFIIDCETNSPTHFSLLNLITMWVGVVCWIKSLPSCCVCGAIYDCYFLASYMFTRSLSSTFSFLSLIVYIFKDFPFFRGCYMAFSISFIMCRLKWRRFFLHFFLFR